MDRRQVVAAALAAPLLLAWQATGHAGEPYRVSSPVVHENLAIYFVRGKSESRPVPLTLDEALAKGAVKVHETGNVNSLAIENLGDLEVFVHSGSIVKGGQQDRVLTISLMLPPKSGRVAIDAFCVEQGRWAARGVEDVRTFASAPTLMPSRSAKIAMKAVRPVPAATEPVLSYAPEPGVARRTVPLPPADPNTVGARQNDVWRAVQETQSKITDRIGAPVRAPESATSLQLSLENERLRTTRDTYIKALQAAGEKDDDIVGYVFAINGKINSAEIYPSNGLFRKLWSKLLVASATEAIGEVKNPADAAPSVEAIQAFLDSGDKGTVAEKKLPADEQLVTRQSDTVVYTETRRADGAWLHRSYLAHK